MSNALRTGQPGSLRAFVELTLGQDHYEACGEIESCLTEDGDGLRAPLRDAGLCLSDARHPELEARFAEAMTDMSSVATNGYCWQLSLPGLQEGGRCRWRSWLVARRDPEGPPRCRRNRLSISRRSPPPVRAVPVAEAPDRLKLIGGDFFESVPTGGDLYSCSDPARLGRRALHPHTVGYSRV